MEVLEHVNNVEKTLDKITKLLKPGGTLILSTINRNLKSLIFAKIFGEYVLNWIPIGTHKFEKFLKPKLTEYKSKVSFLNGNFSAGEQYHSILPRFFSFFLKI